MTRFQMELSGRFGAFWQKEARKQVEEVRSDLKAGRIAIDGDGVARNEIGRALMDDLLEIVEMVAPDAVNVSATRATRTAEVREATRKNRRGLRYAEDLAEMQAAFGLGTEVVDVLSGRRFSL